jgi:signal peptidase I
MKLYLKWFFILIMVFVVVAVILQTFIVRVARVDTAEMWPGLGKGSWVVFKRHATVRRGDVIMFERDGRYSVRRVIALPGDRLEIKDHRPSVVGLPSKFEPLREVTVGPRKLTVERETLAGRSWELMNDQNRNMKDTPVRDVDGFYVFADNRDLAGDSRFYGAIKPADVRGVLWFKLTEGELP